MKKIKIIYEDKYIIVVDKPAGTLSVSTTNEKEKTMFHEVLEYEKKKNKNNKIFVVHRLDRETSGLMVFAKDMKTKMILQNNWDKTIRKYIAVVTGEVSKDSGEIKSYLKETKTFLTYSTNEHQGKLAITRYTKLKSNQFYSLLEIHILTGRKNQIRVHMKDIMHPLIGDKKYGSNVNPIHRLGLCAYKLEFNHPILKKNLKLEIPIPKEFLKLFD